MNLLSYLFGCSHEHVTWPISPRKGAQAWQSCISCGATRPVSFTATSIRHGSWRSEANSVVFLDAPSKKIAVAVKEREGRAVYGETR